MRRQLIGGQPVLSYGELRISTAKWTCTIDYHKTMMITKVRRPLYLAPYPLCLTRYDNRAYSSPPHPTKFEDLAIPIGTYRSGKMSETWLTTARGPDFVLEVMRSAQWNYEHSALSPESLLSSLRDRRLDTRILVAEKAGQVGGLICLQRPRSNARVEGRYDPRQVAGLSAPDSPRDWIYVGGFRSLVSGTTTVAGLSLDVVSEVRQALIRTAFQESVHQGLFPVALYVRNVELPDFSAALNNSEKLHVSDEAILPIGGRNGAEHLDSLSSSARYKVRKEWKMIRELGIEAHEVDAVCMIPRASSLVAHTKLRHGVLDHEKMAMFRLRTWADCEEGEAVAFSIFDKDGKLTGVSFVKRYKKTVEVHEMGLLDDLPNRHLAYTELLIHAPLRYAMRHDCSRLLLGLGSVVPKSQRGAKIYPIWAISLES